MNFIEIYDNALTVEDCKFTIGYMNGDDVVRYPDGTDNICKPGTSGDGNVNPSIKDSIDRRMVFGYTSNSSAANRVNDIVYDALGKCINDYKEKFPELDDVSKWQLYTFYNIQKYKKSSGYFKLHCENPHSYDSSNKRVLAWMVYLNTVTDGGGTYFSNYDLNINAVEGRMVIWPSYWTHQHKGIVSHTQEKYISTGWFSVL